MNHVLLARLSSALAFVLAFSVLFGVCATCSAQEYARDYPQIGNSGSPYWIDCQISGYGRYCIVLPPTINVNAFGFDFPTGYNLINNSGSVISAKAYKIGSSTEAYLCQWSAYDQLYFRVSNGNYWQWQAVTITNIYGTTIDPVDYLSDRGNDYYRGLSLQQRDLVIVLLLAGIVILVLSICFKRFFGRRF